MTIDTAAMNAPQTTDRLSAAETAGKIIDAGKISIPRTREVNNHVHTTYSFSPYSPTLAAFKAWEAGLLAVGSMDHDSIAGADEMMRAGAFIGMATTVGFEIRVNFADTPLAGRKFNSPDSADIVYMAVHGVPAGRIDEAGEFLAPVNRLRNERNRAMTDRLNKVIEPFGIGALDFERDVAAVSMAHDGGSITERHLIYALCRKIMEHHAPGGEVVEFITRRLGLDLPPRLEGYLADAANPHYVYDLLGVLKGSFTPRFFIQPDHRECIPVARAVEFANHIGAIPAYAYLGDVTESPTGDKKAEKFEDDFLDELFALLVELGYKAVTYMPPRNTTEQLLRVQRLCTEHGLMEISGVDINSSRQSFNCPEILEPEFEHLIDATWALVAHEKLAGIDEDYALFSPQNPIAAKPLPERIAAYAAVGREMDHHRPDRAMDNYRQIHEGDDR